MPRHSYRCGVLRSAAELVTQRSKFAKNLNAFPPAAVGQHKNIGKTMSKRLLASAAGSPLKGGPSTQRLQDTVSIVNGAVTIHRTETGTGSNEPHQRTGLQQPKADRSLSNAPAELVGFETWQQNQPPQRSTGNDSRESSSMRSTWATSSPLRMQAFACVLLNAIAARWPKTQNLRHLSLKRGNRRTLFPRKRGTKPGCGSFAARSQSSRSSSLTRSPRRSAWSQARSRSSASCTPKQSRSLQRGTA